jgi:hypothetical protein
MVLAFMFFSVVMTRDPTRTGRDRTRRPNGRNAAAPCVVFFEDCLPATLASAAAMPY